MKYKTTRELSAEECNRNFSLPVGTIVYTCTKPTYNCCSFDEVAVTFNSDGDYPFFGVPLDALEPL